MKRLLVSMLVFLLSFCVASLAGAAAAKDVTTTTSADAAGLEMYKLVYTLTSVAGEDVTVTLPSFGLLEYVSVQIPAADPTDTGFTVRLYSSTSATKFDKFEDQGVTLVNTADVDIYPTKDGSRVYVQLTGGGVNLVASDMGAGNKLTVIFWIWL